MTASRRFRFGLSARILLALLLVTVVAIVSVGVLAVWQTRQALEADRWERAAELTETLALLTEAAIVPERPLGDPRNRERLLALAGQLARAVDADEVVFFGLDRQRIAPVESPGLATDHAGVGGVLAGRPVEVEVRPEEGDETRLVAYAPVRVAGGVVGAVRATFTLDAAVDAVLRRAQLSVVVLAWLDGLLLLLGAAWLLRGMVIQPVVDLERAAKRVAAGDLGARVTVRGPGELASLADAFEEMTESLRTGRESLIRSEKLASVGRLAAGVAHEVGNPLAAVLGYVETLLGDSPERPIDPALRKDILERIRNETRRIDGIVRELLDYARPPREQLEDADVARVVEAVVSLASASPRLRDVDVELALPPDLPPVRADANRLTQVVLNLLFNAADAMDHKGAVRIDARREGDRVVIGVEDEGPGVPPEARERIFDPFYTTKEPGAGTGLGLAVSQSIVDGYGGTLRLAESGRGARFEIELGVSR